MRAGFWEILLIVVLVLILFGHSKIPDLMKNLANGINIFKKELKGGNAKKDDKAAAAKPSAAEKSATSSAKLASAKPVKKKPAAKKK
ncbi:MAG: twin-arginine translocase TatA/TatE family subunit [Rickettsiales bacterium]|jgi:sec-independent protein translocase protein TatA|nr:twin-arginine translocase TatA/TatE family subunit [Rickettsiales bacterium]